jgi:hypothetical protein
MSIRMGIAVAAGLFAAVGLAGSAGAEMAAPPKGGKKVSFVGCAVKQADCVFITNKGKTYNITAAAPADLGLKLRVSGNESTRMSTCQGIILDNLKVSQTRQRCKAPKKK